MKVIGNRKPIEYLLTEEDFSPMDAEFAYLSTTFDMYRPVYTNSKYKASNFAYLEYIYRITTPEQDARDAFQYINKSLHFKLNSLLSAKEISHIEALRALESEIEENELTAISSPNMKICSYSFEDGEFMQEDIIPTDSSIKSVCYLLTMKACYYILYTPVMTFLDGYDPYTGEDKIPFIPDSYLEAAKIELLGLNEGKEVSETKRGKGMLEIMSEGRVTPFGVILDDETLGQPEELVLEKSPSIKKSSRKAQSYYEYPETHKLAKRSYYEPQHFEEVFTPEDNASERFTESDYGMIIPTSPHLNHIETYSRNKNKDQISSISNQRPNQAQPEPSLLKMNKFDAIPDWQRTENQIKKTRSGCGDACNII